mgnify:CR=1 FL=1
MGNTLLGVPLLFWAIVCFSIAIAYYFFWPKPSARRLTPRTTGQPTQRLDRSRRLATREPGRQHRGLGRRQLAGEDGVLARRPAAAAPFHRPVRHAPALARQDAEPALAVVVVGEDAGRAPARQAQVCLLYTSPSPRARTRPRMPSSA